MADTAAARRQSLSFLLLYALAWAGGAIAYVPFLTLWLPSRMTELAGPADVQTSGYVTFFGAIAARAGGIIFGWLSDRTHSRGAWVFAGRALGVTFDRKRVVWGTSVSVRIDVGGGCIINKKTKT